MRWSTWIMGLVVVGLVAACSDSGSGSSGDASTDTDTDTDTDADVDTDSDLDTDTDSDTGTVIDCDPAWGWYDPSTELCWQNPPSTALSIWDESVTYCDDLFLGSHDDWRLPLIQELISLIRGCVNGTATGDLSASECGITDPDCLGGACWGIACDSCDYLAGPDDDPDGCYWDPALAGECYSFWSSSSNTTDVSFALIVDFDFGNVLNNDKNDSGFVRCVRGGL